MLTLEERDIAEKAVALQIMSVDRPRAVLLSMIAEDEFRLEFPLDPQNVKDLAREAIKMCEASQWDRLPPWLQQILSKVARTEPVAKILAKIATPPPNWKNTQLNSSFDTFWIPRLGLPFVDRRKVREALKDLDKQTGPSVLIINGPQKSGKSYCLELITHAVEENMKAAGKNSFIPVGRVVLQPGMGASLTPENLADKIVRTITDNPISLPILNSGQQVVTADRLNEHLCDWIVENAERTGALWWIGLDGLNDPDLLPITRNFIAKLVEVISENGKHSNKLRLIIIDYPREHLVRFAEQIKIEELGPIGDIDVEAFFRKQLEELGGAPPTYKQVKLGVVLTMMQLPQGPTRLQTLNDTLKVVVTNLSREQ
ncbi:MAG TPA: hypothetical protein VF088_18895 [Pyrinomonadaceae bacterium]